MSCAIVEKTLYLIQSDNPILKLQGARDIRRLTKSSLRYRRYFSDAIKPLVDMLRNSESVEYNEAALLALLNLSVKDEGNKKSIIDAGALEPIIGFLQSEKASLQEHATASLLTLSASSVTKPILTSFGVIPLLVDILRCGSPQAKVDSIITLYNLSTSQGNLTLILQTEPISSIVTLLKSCKKSSKTAEKCTALLESLMSYDECRKALTSEEGGILAIVEVLEIGSLQSREHALGALLTMCQSDRCKYRELILREGVVPGLLELTVKGTTKSKEKSQTLLRLLRDAPYERSQLQPDTLENIVSNLISQIDGKEQTGKARGLLAEVIQVSMDQSLRRLHQRPMVCTPVDLSIAGGASTISST
ncbi:U-box domain-containing protein 4-like isoform X1 [Solanum pennellii]|uniref:U-box domain-containing protein 4-like isoform X1 n=2 Tax=Solanum pennellii TaxID=28526 RepID=A0ABM1GB75_SOLPN|nr:U-box domain-containing protein 4-like isoform X1 [Solanum pennellii]